MRINLGGAMVLLFLTYMALRNWYLMRQWQKVSDKWKEDANGWMNIAKTRNETIEAQGYTIAQYEEWMTGGIHDY